MDKACVIQVTKDLYYEYIKLYGVYLVKNNKQKTDYNTKCGNQLFQVIQKSRFLDFIPIPEIVTINNN